jgi:hypothetical protein
MVDCRVKSGNSDNGFPSKRETALVPGSHQNIFERLSGVHLTAMPPPQIRS